MFEIIIANKLTENNKYTCSVVHSENVEDMLSWLTQSCYMVIFCYSLQ